MEAYTKIQEIPEIPGPILDAASNGKLVVFIGAGVSRLLGCPSWQELAQKYLKYLYDKKNISYAEYEYLGKLDPRKLLSICKNFCRKKNINEPNMEDFLKHDVKKYEKFKDLYELLYSWNVVFVTTNFDTYLDQVVNKPKPQPPIIGNELNSNDSIGSTANTKNTDKIISDPDKILISHLYEPGMVIHLHGSLESKNKVVTISDYLHHYKKDNIQEFLSTLFKDFTVLFIGYGLEEYEILEFLINKSDHSKHENKEKEIKHYMLYPLFSWEKNMLEFLQSYYEDLNIKLIPYEKDFNGYEILYEIIKDWTSQIKGIAQPPRSIEIIKLIDEVVK